MVCCVSWKKEVTGPLKLRHTLFLLTMSLCSLGSQHLPASWPLRHAAGVAAFNPGLRPAAAFLRVIGSHFLVENELVREHI